MWITYSFWFLTAYSKCIYFIEGKGGRPFKGINLETQNVQLETHLFTFLFASFFPLMSWNLFILVLWDISLVFINISCLQESRMCERKKHAHSAFSIFLVHSHLLFALSILLLLIPCKNMYSSQRMAPRGNFNTLIYISGVCISHFCKTIWWKFLNGPQPKRNPKDTKINLDTTICHLSASQKSHVLKKAVFLQLKIEVESRKWRKFLIGYH